MRKPYRLKGSDGVAYLNGGPPWLCLGHAYLGLIVFPSLGRKIGWAWREDGRSIDPHDRAFDLIDFPYDKALAETVAADG